MVPTKTTKSQLLIPTKRTISTRNHSNKHLLANVLNDRTKRKAESPPKDIIQVVKRSAFNNLTNAINKTANIDNKLKKNQIAPKKSNVQKKVVPSIKTTLKQKNNENLCPVPEPVNKPITRATLKVANVTTQNQQKTKEASKLENKIKTRLSTELNKTEESLYSSALEILCDTSNKSKNSFLTPESPTAKKSKKLIIELNIGNHEVPSNINNFDAENWDDIFQVSHYAMDIFNYMKDREQLFQIKPYMDRQNCISPWMRSLLVDWMVEVQESFEQNHETLYLGVKLVDVYLSKVVVSKDTLQLVGAAAMFIASKYEERIPPLIDDFLYICDGAYNKRQLLKMEINILKICDFNLGIPLSYRFLRRYARCAKVSMVILTLARYILEYSLMDYAIVPLQDSKVAAASLYIALQMKKHSNWTPTLEFYTGYKLADFIDIVIILNNGLHKKPKEQLAMVRNKYLHKVFFEVAKTELLSNEELLCK